MPLSQFILAARRNIVLNNFKECMEALEVNREIEVHKTVAVLSLVMGIYDIMETDGLLYDTLWPIAEDFLDNGERQITQKEHAAIYKSIFEETEREADQTRKQRRTDVLFRLFRNHDMDFSEVV